MDAADPGAPPPEGEPWEPLRLGELPPAPDFPLDALPSEFARFVTEAAGGVGCNPGMVAGPVVATAGDLIGRSASLRLGPNWFAHPCVFLANVAHPGRQEPVPRLPTAPRPGNRLVRFSDAGKAEFDRLHDAHVDEVNGTTSPTP